MRSRRRRKPDISDEPVHRPARHLRHRARLSAAAGARVRRLGEPRGQGRLVRRAGGQVDSARAPPGFPHRRRRAPARQLRRRPRVRLPGALPRHRAQPAHRLQLHHARGRAADLGIARHHRIPPRGRRHAPGAHRAGRVSGRLRRRRQPRKGNQSSDGQAGGFVVMTERKRWLAFYLLCAGEFMIVIDTTIINVALPSIQADLAFTDSSLVWVVNAYMVTYGGFLLLGGRMGDLYGSRRWFLLGTAIFTVASLVCALANTQWLLVVARAIQGLGGAAVSAIALSLIMNLFSEAADRAKAMGIYGFICAGGGSVGVLAGGVLTSALGWHWIFLVNLPIGALVCALCFSLLSPDRASGVKRQLDVAGAITVTLSSMLAIYGIVNGNYALLVAAGGLFGAFLAIESRIGDPLMPLRLFRIRSIAVSNVIGVLWAAAMFAWFFISALYMQLVLGYTPMQIGLAFLPANLIMAVFSIGLSAKLVMRFGLKLPIAGGMLLAAAGLGLFAVAPSGGSFMLHVLPGMLLLGIGCGMALNPVMLAGMSAVEASESGLASGVLNTSFMMGGALGLAALASLSEAKGYHAAFAVGALFAALAAVLTVFLKGSHDAEDHDVSVVRQ